MTMSIAMSDSLLGVYGERDLCLVSGTGCELQSEDGRTFLDFTSGIGVNALGYDHAGIRDAIERVVSTGLLHTSNLFLTNPAAQLANALVERSFASKVFFCNSGTEANEAAIKFARRYAGPSRHKIIAVRGSFHGRTYGALSATDRPGYQKPFAPLLPGVEFIERDVGSISNAIDGTVAAVIIEPIQGEGGVRPIEHEFLQALRRACDSTDALLILDEVQCGLGRTGSLFAYEQCGVVPDVLTLAKPLGGGLPIGATLLNDTVADAIQPGDHASTFGGGPLVATVALTVVETIGNSVFLENVRTMGDRLGRRLKSLVHGVREVRGRGLMWGLVVEGLSQDVQMAARERGLLVLTAGPDIVRLLPPLIVQAEDIDRAVDILETVL